MADVLPGLESVYDHELLGASDQIVFDWARRMGFAALISADRDFVSLAERLGAPPKVIRIERGDLPPAAMEKLLRREAVRIHAFLESERAVLSRGHEISSYRSGPMSFRGQYTNTAFP